MAIGDFIIQNSALNTAQSYTPAGTNIMILISFTNGGSGSTEVPAWDTAVGLAEMIPPNANTGSNSTIRSVYDYASLKLPIDNTHPVAVPPSGLASPTCMAMVQVA